LDVERGKRPWRNGEMRTGPYGKGGVLPLKKGGMQEKARERGEKKRGSSLAQEVGTGKNAKDNDADALRGRRGKNEKGDLAIFRGVQRPEKKGQKKTGQTQQTNENGGRCAGKGTGYKRKNNRNRNWAAHAQIWFQARHKNRTLFFPRVGRGAAEKETKEEKSQARRKKSGRNSGETDEEGRPLAREPL